MKNLKGFEKITDYAWIKKGRKYWIEMDLVTGQQEVKRDFVKRFPDVEWAG